jgi:hypothetical protein
MGARKREWNEENSNPASVSPVTKWAGDAPTSRPWTRLSRMSSQWPGSSPGFVISFSMSARASFYFSLANRSLIFSESVDMGK